MIELKQVTKQYGQATVLKNITLSIDEPGIYCLLGRNGAGKTTLLKSVAGYQNIVKRLLASNKISFIIMALVVLCATSSGDVVLSNGNYTWLLAVMTPFFFVFYDYTKLMHLGASKRDYFFGCLISYGVLALGISLINTLIHLLIDPVYPAQAAINMMDVCKWTENGIIIAGVQQMFFLLLVMIFLHVLLSM